MELQSPPKKTVGDPEGIRTPDCPPSLKGGDVETRSLSPLKTGGRNGGFQSPGTTSDLCGTPAASQGGADAGSAPAPRALGFWKLGDGTEIPAAIEHEYAQRELLHAQTPGVNRHSYKRGIDNATNAHRAVDEYEARRNDIGGVPEGQGERITLTPRGALCADLYARYEAGEVSREAMLRVWGKTWDADRAKAVAS